MYADARKPARPPATMRLSHRKGFMKMEPNTKIMRYTTHPMLLIAAIAVILFCGVGIAAVMGWLPKSGASMGPPVAAEAPVQVGGNEMGPPPAPAGLAAVERTPGRAADTSGYSGGGGSYGGGAAPAERNADARYAEAAAAQPVAQAAERAPAVCHSC